MKPLISIIIPTRGRQKYCIAAIDDILSYPNVEFELCIQDNSDDDQISMHIKKNYSNDIRIKYRHNIEPLNFVLNISKSFELATGKYVILLGDDDTILPELFNVVHWMDLFDIDSVCPINIVDYFWPGAHPQYPNGWMSIPTIKDCNVKKIDVQKQTDILFKNGTIRYLKYYLPKVYHGIIKRDLMEQIKNQTGNYSGGLSPDIYISIALTALVRNHYTIEVPISIAGACSKSATSQDINKGHRGELSQAPHFNLRGPYQWDKLVPAYYSIDTIWAESALHAVKDMKIPYLRQKFNFNYMAAYAIMYNRSIASIAIKNTFSKDNEAINCKVWNLICIVFSGLGILLGYLSRKVRRLFIRSVTVNTFDNVKDITQARKCFEQNFKLCNCFQ